MKLKVVDGFSKGMIVRKRQTWGDHAGEPDMTRLYLIRQIGDKACMLDRVDEQTMQKRIGYRGHNEYKHTKAEYDERVSRWASTTPVSFPYNWQHILVAVGQEGWDPDF